MLGKTGVTDLSGTASTFKYPNVPFIGSLHSSQSDLKILPIQDQVGFLDSSPHPCSATH